MPPLLISVCGWVPATIIPIATLVQLYSIVRNRSVAGVSALTWALFGTANIGLYIYTEKYGDLQAIAGLLGSAALDFVIAAMVLVGYGTTLGSAPTQTTSSPSPSSPPS